MNNICGSNIKIKGAFVSASLEQFLGRVRKLDDLRLFG